MASVDLAKASCDCSVHGIAQRNLASGLHRASNQVGCHVLTNCTQLAGKQDLAQASQHQMPTAGDGILMSVRGVEGGFLRS